MPAMSTLAPWAALPLCLCGCGVLVMLRRKKKSVDPRTHGQVPWPATKNPVPGAGAPLLTGLRVVEVASVYAAPACARIFADLGAEVIKVEGPGGVGGDDSIRDALLSIAPKERQERGVSIVFEAVNLGKRSVVMNLRQERGKFIDMLRDADVLITNVSQTRLAKLKLDYDALKDELPHLVVGQVDAWGHTGDDSELPGFDASAFWAASGLAHQMHSPKEYQYSMYPVGFGDCTSSCALFGGVMSALAERLTNGGKGRYVTCSLYRLGIFCNAVSLLKMQQLQRHAEDVVGSASPATDEPKRRLYELGVPDYNVGKFGVTSDPTYNTYRSKDGVVFAVLVPPADGLRIREEMRARLAGGTTSISDEQFCSRPSERSATTQLFREAFLRMNYETEIQPALEALGVPVVRRAPSDQLPGDSELALDCYADLPGVPDIPKGVPKVPFDFSCSDEHGHGSVAPTLGVHTQAFFSQGWSPRPHQCDAAPPAGATPLTIFEVSEPRSSNIAAAVQQFTDMMAGPAGCKGSPRVVRAIVPGVADDYWSEVEPDFHAFLCRGKHTATFSSLAELREEIVSCTGHVVLATNVRLSAVKEAGLDYESLRAVRKDIIVLCSTPFGIGSREDARGDLGGWYLGSTVSEMFSGFRGASPPEQPPQLGELCSSMALFGALAAAHFHRLRTGEGQLANVPMHRFGAWGLVGVSPMANDPKYWENFKGLVTPGERALQGPTEEWEWCRYANPVFVSLRTADGAWVLITAGSIRKMLDHNAKFGATHKVIWNIIRFIVSTKLFGTKDYKGVPHKGDVGVAVLDGLASATIYYRRVVESMTLEEWRAWADTKNVWWGPVLTPAEVPKSSQAFASGALVDHGHGSWDLRVPVQAVSKV